MTLGGGVRLGRVWGRGPSQHLTTCCLCAGAATTYILAFPAAHTLRGHSWGPALHQAEGFSPSWGPGGNPYLLYIHLTKPRVWSPLRKDMRETCQSIEKLPELGGWGVMISHHSRVGFFPLPPLCLIKRTSRGKHGLFWATMSSWEALSFPVSSSCLSPLL